MKLLKSKKLILTVAAVLIILTVGGVILMNTGHYVSLKGQHLKKYTYSSGGGMTGGYYSKTVEKTDDDKALITVETAEWHNNEPEVKKYIVDSSVLFEIEKVVRRYRMNFWHNKKFTKMFVADGESYSYGFRFDEAYIDFSSQIYPLRYRVKLKKLDEIIENYIEGAKELSSLK